MKSVILVLIVMASFSLSVMADEITLFGNNDQKPKAYFDNNGNPTGFSIDIAAAVLKRAGYKVNIKLTSFKRGLEYSKNCQGVMTGVFKTPEREKFLRYSVGNVADKAVFVVKKGNVFQYEDLSSLNDMHVTYLRGAAFGKAFEQADNFKRNLLNDPAKMMKQLYGGRTDVVIINPGVAAAAAAANDADINFNSHFDVIEQPLNENMNYIVGCNKEDNTEMFNRINNATQALLDDGSIQTILSQYN